MKVQWIAVAAAVAVLLIVTGCNGTGDMGGQPVWRTPSSHAR